MNKTFKSFLSLVLAVFMALSCVVISSAAELRYGDINGDSTINSADALLILRHSVKNIELKGNEFTAADVNADAVLNASDALLVLQYAVGMIKSFPAEGKVDLPETKDEILALYTKTVNNARAEIPAYKLRTKSEVTDAKVSGSYFLLSPPSEVKKYEEGLKQKSDYSNLFKADSQTALLNLPAVCHITDVSKFRSITCKVLEDGNYQIDIAFKDEKDPKAGSPVVMLMNLPDKQTLLETMQEEMDEALKNDPSINDFFEEGSDLSGAIKISINSLQYVNGSISCVIDSKTGEFVSYKSVVETKMVLKTVILGMTDMVTDTKTESIFEYSNFIY